MLRKNLFLATKKKTLSNQIKKKVKICRGVWFVFLNNYFQFLNNILRIFIHFFYPYTFSQIFSNNNFQFLSIYTKRILNLLHFRSTCKNFGQ